MSFFVYALPYTPPAPPVDPWRGVSMRWEAPDGTAWDLCGPRSGGIRLLAGARGLTEPPREVFIDETAGTQGGRWAGYRDLVRDVFWPISVWKDTGSVEWLEYDAAWWRSLDPDEPGRWVVTHPNGSERHLLVRFVDDGNPTWDTAPGMRAWARYGIKMVAVDPYWRGQQVALSWSGAVDEGETFVGDGGPPLTLSEGSTLAGAQLTNPGDLPAYPVWWVQDVTAVDVTVDGRVIEVPVVADDKLLVVDSDPAALSAIEVDAPPDGLTTAEQDKWVADRLPDGLDRTIELGPGTTWGEIPRRATVDVGIEMTGAGTVHVRFTPRYRRAW